MAEKGRQMYEVKYWLDSIEFHNEETGEIHNFKLPIPVELRTGRIDLLDPEASYEIAAILAELEQEEERNDDDINIDPEVKEWAEWFLQGLRGVDTPSSEGVE